MRRTARDLTSARDLASDLASDLDRYLVNALNLVSGLDRHFAIPPDLVFARDLARDLDLLSVRARVVIVFFSDPALARDLAFARDLTHDLDRYLDDRSLDWALDLRSVRGVLARACAHDLVSALDRARRSAASAAGATAADGARPVPSRAARGLVALAVRLLPAGQRPRYREEFGVDLVELARRQRYGYALQLLANAWELRKALVNETHTANGEPVRRVGQ